MPAFVVGVANLFGGSYVTVGYFNLSVSQLNAITESITLTYFFILIPPYLRRIS